MVKFPNNFVYCLDLDAIIKLVSDEEKTMNIITIQIFCIPQGLKGEVPFWALLGTQGIDENTPSVSDDGNYSGAPQPSFSGSPVTGMYFLHPDHLGSISLLTDSNGKMVAGIDINSGKSHVSYKPYGEINRTNSSGPDIFRYKYSGQMEDGETDLYYYKARYYDPKLGRFLQADSVTNAESPMGLNHYMYTEGNPVKYRDPDGHRLSSAQAWAVIGYLQGPNHGVTREEGAMLGYAYGAGIDKKEGRNSATGGKKNNIDPGKAWDTTFGNKGLWGDIRGGELGKFWDSTIGNKGLWGYIDRKVSRWWYIQKHEYADKAPEKGMDEDYSRSVVKIVLQESFCDQYGDSSMECQIVTLASMRDTNRLRKKYYSLRREAESELNAGCSITYNGVGFEPSCTINGKKIPHDPPKKGGAGSQTSSPGS